MSSVLSLTVALPTILALQDPAVLERRLARLDQLRKEADILLTRADSARREVLDTVRAGSLFIIVRPQDAPLVRRGAELAWPRLDSLYGDEAAMLANRPILFWFLTREVRVPSRTSRRLQPVIADTSSTPEDVARRIMTGAATVLRDEADSALTVWLGSLLVPMNQPDAELGRIYVDLVTTPAAAVRRCYEGDAASCRAALGLPEGGDPALWYDAAERRALVRKMNELQRQRSRAAADACLIAHSDEGCLEVLRATPYLDAPLTEESRHSFARMALAAGGPGAYRRLIRSAGRPLSQRFMVASRLSADSLARRWRATVIAARPKTVTLAAIAGWTALGWCIAFGLFALRSTRWR